LLADTIREGPSLLDNNERLTYSLSSSHSYREVTFLLEYYDPREPRWLVTSIDVRLDDVPESDYDAHAFLLARIEQDLGGINDLEALSMCTRIADEMLWEIKSFWGQD